MTVGIDEVGRGCWAGPVVAAAVLLGNPIAGLNDSKLLSKVRRTELAELIQLQAGGIGIGWVWPKEVDAQGLTWAVSEAMRQALAGITGSYEEVIIDGSYNFLSYIPVTKTLVKADATVPAVSAASIVAKIARDAYMSDIAHQTYPEYGFDRNVGYGTPHHIAMLREHGVSPIHRQSVKPIQEMLLQSRP